MKNYIFKIIFPLFALALTMGQRFVQSFFVMDSLVGLSTLSKSGGGYTALRFAPKSWLDSIPLPDADNPEITSNDFRFKQGKGWIYIFVDNYKTDAPEKQNDSRFSSSYISTCNFFIPGDNNDVRKGINEGIFAEEGYLLVDNCKDRETTLFGKGSCCAGTMKLDFESGKKASEEKGWTCAFTVEQEGVNTKYKGVGAINEEFAIAADDATPDVSKGTATYLLPSNVAATEITDLDNAIQGSLITFKYTGSINLSTFTNGATFQLTGAFVPVTGAIIVFQATTTGTFAERYRDIPA